MELSVFAIHFKTRREGWEIAPDSVLNISSSFQISLPDCPVSCNVANPRLFGEVLSDGMLLVYGGCELVFCCSCKENKEDAFYTEVISHKLIKKILPEKTGFTGNERVQVITNSPLSIQVRAGKPSRVSIWKRLVSIIRDRTWVEVVVEGEISVEVVGSSFQNRNDKRKINEQDVSEGCGTHTKAPEIPTGFQQGKASEQFAVLHDSESVALSIDSLVDLVIKVIKQREKDILPSRMPDSKIDTKEKLSDQCSPVKDEMDILTDVLQQIMAQGEKGKKQQGGVAVRSQKPTAFDLSSIPLERIPSRPGLHQTIVQNIPPPKPTNHNG